MAEWTEEYRRRMREFMERRGSKVEVDKRYDWQDDDAVSTYGWQDTDAYRHTAQVSDETFEKYRKVGLPYDRCRWVVPEGAVLYERTYSQFADTFSGNKEEVGINVRGCHCACGKYTDVILRFDGSLADVMQELTGAPTRAEVTL